MNKGVKAIGIICLSALALTMMCSCKSSTTKLLESSDTDAKYEAAMKAYKEGDFHLADRLFENLLLYARGRDKAEDVNYYYGKSLMANGDYISAGYQFEAFVKLFPYSKYTEDALFQSAYCKYMESPAYNLDQTLTKESMSAFSTYIDLYPSSPLVKDANKYIDELRLKLIKKDYFNAYNYYRVGQYQAAHVALNNFINKYSDQTEYRQNAMYYIILSDYHYAAGSVEERQKERWNTVILDYERYQALFESFTDSSKKADLKSKYEYAKKQVEKL